MSTRRHLPQGADQHPVIPEVGDEKGQAKYQHSLVVGTDQKERRRHSTAIGIGSDKQYTLKVLNRKTWEID